MIAIVIASCAVLGLAQGRELLQMQPGMAMPIARPMPMANGAMAPMAMPMAPMANMAMPMMAMPMTGRKLQQMTPAMPMANSAMMMPKAPAMAPMMMPMAPAMANMAMPMGTGTGRKLQDAAMAPMMMSSSMMPMAPMTSMTKANNAFAAIQMNMNLSTLATALMKANLSMALSDPMFMGTIFAPTNDAFMRYLGAHNMTVDQLLASPNLKMILEYHVVPSMAAKASMLMNGMKLSTMANSPLTVAAMPAPATIFGAQSNAIVQMADMMAGKAIIHIINQVLLPPANMMSSS